MAGRGRGKTLPAWMTSSEVAEESTAVSDNTNNSFQSQQYANLLGAESGTKTTFATETNYSAVNNVAISTTSAAFVSQQRAPALQPPIQSTAIPQGQSFPASGTAPQFYPPQTVSMNFPNQLPQHFQPPFNHQMLAPQFNPAMQQMYMNNPPMMGAAGMMLPTQQGVYGMNAAPGPMVAAAPVPPQLNDPNNDRSSWSEHEAADGRVYYYNAITKKSTYDKPECMKTAEERSIPPCPWKEYSADGKKYYSDGKESRWDMPEEFRVWKEKMDAVQKKKQNKVLGVPSQIQNLPTSTAQLEKTSSNNATNSTASNVSAELQSENRHQQTQRTSSSAMSSNTDASDNKDAPVYATKEEAVDAFKKMLSDHDISSASKFKDVQDQCVKDHRWNALRSLGERKQALAEYQTKRLKEEKELKRIQMRKARDTFFQMLAENTNIDAHTTWRNAQTILQDDRRFKACADDRDRESYYDEFIKELLKKEREDMEKLKVNASAEYNKLLDYLLSNQKINRKSIWNECKTEIYNNIALITQPSQKIIPILEDSDLRRLFQDFVANIERKERKFIRDIQDKFILLLKSKLNDSTINPFSKWKDIMGKICNEEVFIELDQKAIDIFSSLNTRSTFDKFIQDIYIEYTKYDEVLLNVLYKKHSDLLVITHTSNYSQFKASIEEIFKKSFPGEELYLPESVIDQNQRSTDANDSKDSMRSKSIDRSKHDDSWSVRDMKRLRDMIVNREWSLKCYFDDIHNKKVDDYEYNIKKQKKREERYIELLSDYFYLSEHINLSWEDAKKDLERHSAYDDLDRNDRKRLFLEHMSNLSAKMDAKNKSLRQLLESSENSNKQIISSSNDDIPVVKTIDVSIPIINNPENTLISTKNEIVTTQPEEVRKESKSESEKISEENKILVADSIVSKSEYEESRDRYRSRDSSHSKRRSDQELEKRRSRSRDGRSTNDTAATSKKMKRSSSRSVSKSRNTTSKRAIEASERRDKHSRSDDDSDSDSSSHHRHHSHSDSKKKKKEKKSSHHKKHKKDKGRSKSKDRKKH